MNTKTRIKFFAGAIASVVTIAFVLNDKSNFKNASKKINAKNNESVFFAGSKKKAAIAKLKDSNDDWDNFSMPLEEFNKKHKPKKHTYYFDANKDILISTNNKTKIFIPFNALNTDTLSKEKIRVEVTEYLSKDKILFAGLTTLSDGRLLESAGMFEINCYQNNRQLQLKKGKYAELTVPKELPNEFNIFNATNQNEQLNWELSPLGSKSNKRSRYENVDRISGLSIKIMRVTVKNPHGNPFEIFIQKNDSLVPFIKYFEQHFKVPKSMYQFCEKTDYQLEYSFFLDTFNNKINAIFPDKKNKADFPERYLNAFLKKLPPLVFIKNEEDDKKHQAEVNEYCLVISSKEISMSDTCLRSKDSLAVF